MNAICDGALVQKWQIVALEAQAEPQARDSA
jgi:hypothetical protein